MRLLASRLRSSASPASSWPPPIDTSTAHRPVSDCYIVFGEAKPEDASGFPNFAQMGQQAQAQAQQQQALGGEGQKEGEGEEGAGAPGAAATEEDDGEVDETGLEQDDINVVMSQANCSRARGPSLHQLPLP